MQLPKEDQKMFKFHEHIVRVGAIGFNRDRLWRGLEESVRHPEKFIEHMESSSILSEELKTGGRYLSRKIDFGTVSFHDTVILRDGESITTIVAAGEHWPASIFTLRIEEPSDGDLFVRFIYEEEERPDQALNPAMLQIRRQAYEAKDKHLIEVIQELPFV